MKLLTVFGTFGLTIAAALLVWYLTRGPAKQPFYVVEPPEFANRHSAAIGLAGLLIGAVSLAVLVRISVRLRTWGQWSIVAPVALAGAALGFLGSSFTAGDSSRSGAGIGANIGLLLSCPVILGAFVWVGALLLAVRKSERGPSNPQP